MTRAVRQVLVIGLGAAVVWLDSAVNIAFPAIVRGFDLAIGDIQWVVISYVLTYTSLLLAFGRIGDMFGHALVFRLGLVSSAIALLLCALTPSYPELLLCRFLQGIGASLVLSCGPALTTGLYGEDRRSRVLGLYTMMMALGATLGPFLGGLLTTAWGWPAVFWFRVPIALAALAALGTLPVPPRGAARERFDFAGALLLVLALVALLLALSRLSGRAAMPLGALSLVALAGFVWQELRSERPVLDLRVFRLPGFALLNFASVLTNLAGFAVWLLVPFYLTRASANFTLGESGAVLAAASLGAVVAGPGSARLIGWITAERLAPIGAAMVSAGLALISLWDRSTATSALIAALLVQGLGIGVFQLAYVDIVTATIPRQHRGVAGSLTMVTRTLGTVGAAALVMLLFQRLAAAGDFFAAFRRSFGLAALLPFAMAVLLAWRAHGAKARR